MVLREVFFAFFFYLTGHGRELPYERSLVAFFPRERYIDKAPAFAGFWFALAGFSGGSGCGCGCFPEDFQGGGCDGMAIAVGGLFSWGCW